MDQIQNIIDLFAEDILTYQRLGGNMNNITANNVYNLIDKNINNDNEPFNEQVFKDKLIIENDINHINELYLEAKNKLEKKLIYYVFRKMKSSTYEFESLSTKEKIIFLTNAYRLISYQS